MKTQYKHLKTRKIATYKWAIIYQPGKIDPIHYIVTLENKEPYINDGVVFVFHY